ncbi:MAG: archaea-specific RecJ-like exonuclease, contains DnaJ-type Zn finger domain protein [halophilic archaeon J07HX64]|jgi:Archaea-specific RecJ-like exonuclease, contains DnaJ-type Zn finger domain|nr:MAG: archaea-specific RecJ-like exonuclease, contains DnaJ-type Zn finger domain protein [halophilic archaeon J07HX64]
MTSCIICGTSADDRVCELHEEDVVFEFRGTKPGQLTSGRYYRGTVDGFADFGIFIDIGERVTGLLHRSELDSRLESIELDSGETVYVQVQNVRDNGNVDLSWSIRQDRSRFRGALVDDPDAEETTLLDPEENNGSSVVRTTAGEQQPSGDSDSSRGVEDDSTSESPADTADVDSTEAGDAAVDDTDTDSTEEDSEQADPTPSTVDELGDLVGDSVSLEGELTGARQTSGPTVFTLRDETGTVECAAFEEAGVRAYPEAEEGDIVRIEGEPERRRGDLQVETEGLTPLDGDERAAVLERIEDALVQRARPDEVQTLGEDPAVAAVTDEIAEVATMLRRAVIEGRPVVVRHAGTVDGYVAGTALERATLPLVRELHGRGDAEYHQFERRPLEGSAYDMDDATRDVTTMLTAEQRHDEPVPLFVFVGAGSPESVDGFDLLGVYDAERVIVDDRPVDPAVANTVELTLAPDEQTTTTALATAVAATTDPTVREDLRHLPAVSAWTGPSESYGGLAASAGYDPDGTTVLREALALVAHYQAYEDKRELVSDLLFADDADIGLAEHISEQYRTRMDTAVETARANIEHHSLNGQTVLVLDTDAYTHQYEFPPTGLLLDELHRREDTAALVGLDRDGCLVRTTSDVDIDDLVASAREHAPEAALDTRSARDGHVEFLAGERDAARKALLDALATELSAPAA